MTTGSFFHPPNRHRADSLETARTKSRMRDGWAIAPPTPRDKAGNLAYLFSASPASQQVVAHLQKTIEDFGPERHSLRTQSRW